MFILQEEVAMRNPKRIPEFLNVIQQLWEKQPDSRFNQLVHNLQYEFAKEKGEQWFRKTYEVNEFTQQLEYRGGLPDLFYIEDEEFLNWLKKKL